MGGVSWAEQGQRSSIVFFCTSTPKHSTGMVLSYFAQRGDQVAWRRGLSGIELAVRHQQTTWSEINLQVTKQKYSIEKFCIVCVANSLRSRDFQKILYAYGIRRLNLIPSISPRTVLQASTCENVAFLLVLHHTLLGEHTTVWWKYFVMIRW